MKPWPIYNGKEEQKHSTNFLPKTFGLIGFIIGLVMKKRFNKTDKGVNLEIDMAVLELLGISPDDEIEIKTNGNSLIIEKSKEESSLNEFTENEKKTIVLPPTPESEEAIPSYVSGKSNKDNTTKDTHIPDSAKQFQKDLDYYWQ